MRPFFLAPSLLSADPLTMARSIEGLEGNFDWLHVDVMDGHYVPNLTYGPGLVEALRARYPEAWLDVHLMVEPADEFVEMFLRVGPNGLTVHQESCRHLHRVLARVRSAGVRAGVALNPATPTCLIEPVLDQLDLVLLMSVNPGFGGQIFIPGVCRKAVELARLRAVRELDFLIEMDGGLNEETLAPALASGVDAVVMGNALFKSDDPAQKARAVRKHAMEVLAGE